MADLKPCPFCGKKASISTKKMRGSQSFKDGDDNCYYYFVGCFKPKCSVKPKTLAPFSKLAVSYWNTRV